MQDNISETIQLLNYSQRIFGPSQFIMLHSTVRRAINKRQARHNFGSVYFEGIKSRKK